MSRIETLLFLLSLKEIGSYERRAYKRNLSRLKMSWYKGA